MNHVKKTIVLYDGQCGLCSSVVRFVLKHDSKGVFHFAALQSKISKEILTSFNITKINLDTFYLIENNKLYERSTAAIRVLKKLGAFWKFCSFFMMLIPIKLRNGIYNFIAKNRKTLYSSKNCIVPTEAQKKKFLDM